MKRTHKCNQVTSDLIGQEITISGRIHRRRDHGGVIFFDVRDEDGLVQVVYNPESKDIFSLAETCRNEFVIFSKGIVNERPVGTANDNLITGEVEIIASDLDILNPSLPIPFQLDEYSSVGEETRLKYRFLDLRRTEMQDNLRLRSKVSTSLRNYLDNEDFIEIETPLLTKATPEGARDYLVPSRTFPGQFFALPQSPQLFKQTLMASGFEKYFQFAKCFRDEDLRADRQPEFTQLDIEMSFVDSKEVMSLITKMIKQVFKESLSVDLGEFVEITYREAIEKYGVDKPDLRNPIQIVDVTDVFDGSGFSLFANLIASKNAVVRAVPGPKCGSRSVADRMNSWAQGEGAPGMGYIIYGDGEAKGPVAGALGKEKCDEIKNRLGLQNGDAAFFSCSNKKDAADLAGKARVKIGIDQGISETDGYKFCWIIDFPMYELDEKGKIEFSHNPFSMPQGGLDALNNQNPLDIKAWQYDLVCNGVELSSGAIRNHLPEVMYKAFEIAGYSKETVDANFSGMISAFKFGAPPHGGFAPGIDRIVMLIANEPNIREVILFPMNGKAEDLMMGAPSEVSDDQLKELNIKKNKIIK